MYQLYFSDTSCFSDDATNFILINLTQERINSLLTNKEFLKEYSDYFEEGITGWKMNDNDQLTIQYWSWCESFEEATLCFKKVIMI